MQAELKKNHSTLSMCSTSSGSRKELKFVPPARFNIGPQSEKSKTESEVREKKERIAQQLRMLRNDKSNWDSQKIISGQSSIHIGQERNQQSLIYLHSQNTPPAFLLENMRKSMPKESQIVMKKVISYKEGEERPSLKKIPTFHKALSVPDQTICQTPMRNCQTPLRNPMVSVRMVW